MAPLQRGDALLVLGLGHVAQDERRHGGRLARQIPDARRGVARPRRQQVVFGVPGAGKHNIVVALKRRGGKGGRRSAQVHQPFLKTALL